MNIPEGWQGVLQALLEEQQKHYGEMYVLGSAGSAMHMGEAHMTEGVIKGVEYCIEVLAAAPTPPAPEVEPVAWMHDGGTRVDIAHADVKELWLKVVPKRVEHYMIPLYTHPANDGLRKAAEDAADLLHILDSFDEFDRNDGAAILHNLRAELDKR